MKNEISLVLVGVAGFSVWLSFQVAEWFYPYWDWFSRKTKMAIIKGETSLTKGQMDQLAGDILSKYGDETDIRTVDYQFDGGTLEIDLPIRRPFFLNLY